MSIIYKSIQSKLENKEGELLYHPRAIYTGTVGTDQLAREVAAYSSLTPGDVKNTIHNLVTVMTQHMQSSEIVTLDELGSFRIAFRSRGKGAKTRAEVDASQAITVVRFSPASTRNADRTVATRSMLTGARFTNMDDRLGSGSTDSGNTEGGNQGGGNQGGGDSGENPMG